MNKSYYQLKYVKIPKFSQFSAVCFWNFLTFFMKVTGCETRMRQSGPPLPFSHGFDTANSIPSEPKRKKKTFLIQLPHFPSITVLRQVGERNKIKKEGISSYLMHCTDTISSFSSIIFFRRIFARNFYQLKLWKLLPSNPDNLGSKNSQLAVN